MAGEDGCQTVTGTDWILDRNLQLGRSTRLFPGRSHDKRLEVLRHTNSGLGSLRRSFTDVFRGCAVSQVCHTGPDCGGRTVRNVSSPSINHPQPRERGVIMSSVSTEVCSKIHEDIKDRLDRFEEKQLKVAEDVAFIRGQITSNKSWVANIMAAIACLVAWFK